MTVFGVFIALLTPGLNFLKVLGTSAPATPLEPAVVGWAILLGGAGIAGFALSMHHEKDAWWCFLGGLGLPSLFVALTNVPQLFLPH